MADYIYLLQNRLSPAQWRALEAVREAARAQGTPVFLVGGAVRDLTTGSPVRDLDFAVQGEVRALVSQLEGMGAAMMGENPALSAVYLSMRGGVRVEIGSTLRVSYPKPGQLEAHTAGILDDLRRRDFTANAMAVSLNEGSYGLLLDPLNGTADIENRELRLVSPYGFIEQPGLMLRAARLSERLGWSLEERTQGRYENSKNEEHIGALPAWDRGYELEEIFHEEDPLAVLEHMDGEGWREVLFPPLGTPGADRNGLDEVRDLVGQLEGQRLYPDPSAVYFPLVTAKLGDENRAALKKLFARRGFVRQIETLEARAKELGNQLTAKSAPQSSDAWKLLVEAEPELVLWLAYHSRSGAVQTRIKAFLKDWPQMRSKIPYGLMQEMRITPDLPQYEQLLDDLFFALIDGKLDTVEATRAFLEPFSPPAPPQVSVRRRPAKPRRGSKRAVEEPVSEPEEAAEAEAADEAIDAGEEGDAGEATMSFTLPTPVPVNAMVEEEPEPQEGELSAVAKTEPVAVMASLEGSALPMPAENAPAQIKTEREKKVAGAKVAGVKKTVKHPAVVKAAEKVTPPAKAAAVKTIVTAKKGAAAVKAVAGKVAAVKTAGSTPGNAKASSVKTAAAKKQAQSKSSGMAASLAKNAVKLSGAPKKAVAKLAKVAAKGAPAKVAVKAPAKAGKKVAVKKTTSKPAVKAAPAKAGAKKQPTKGRASAPAKKAVPVSAGKKAAGKKRGGH